MLSLKTISVAVPAKRPLWCGPCNTGRWRLHLRSDALFAHDPSTRSFLKLLVESCLLALHTICIPYSN